MKIRNVVIAIVVVAASIGLFVFFTQGLGKNTTGNSVAVSPVSSSSTSMSSTGKVDVIQATISHSDGYYFQGDAATDPTTITVSQRDTVKIITNDLNPSHNHGITIDGYGINQVTSNNPVIQFTADKTGTFKIWCQTCLDGPLGAHPWMTGTLVVNP
jgi:plastocyanin